MRASVSVVEQGLSLVFIGRSLTRIYCWREVERLQAAGVRARKTPDISMIPAWVSLLVVGGWAIVTLGTATLLVG
ncbi:MAG: hypothetical protein LC647_12595 [Beggiatoa sp.]|nr:hypothetical protein [Beggiatoa sp.]